MTTIVLDGLNEEDFRRSIENRLREARPGAAIERLRPLLAPYAKPGGLLPERFLEVEAADLVLSGWEELAEAVSRHDKPGRPVTAISITFGWPGEDAPGPDAAGRLRPHVETSYYSDNAYPFSQSGRDDLLEGYSYYGCTWSGDCEASDAVLSLEGIDDLHGALVRLEAQLLATDEPDEDGIRAGSLGACLLSVLLVQAVAHQITRNGLPRPLCVMAGSSGIYPYFDAPVAGMPEEALKAAEALDEAEEAPEEEVVVEVGRAAPAQRYSSLLMTGIPRAKKRAVLVLNESEGELADRIAKLRNLNQRNDEDSEALQDAMPIDAAPEILEPFAVPAPGGPLLAQKPARQARDLNEMFGLSSAERPAIETPPREPPIRVDPALPSARSEPPLVAVLPSELAVRAEPGLPTGPSEPHVGPGFTLLDSSVEQRLRKLIAASTPPIAESPRLAPATSQELRPAKSTGQPARTGKRPPLRARLWRKAKAWLARFGRHP